MDSHDNPLLRGIKVVSLSINAPGPVAASRLAKLGASVTKIEPPAGDPLKTVAPAWYQSLCSGQTILTLDLKSPSDRQKLEPILADADLLLASFRPSALRRLELDWESVHARHPRLCFAGIIGYPPPLEERSGHDLTYLASVGLLSPPQLPPSLFVDLAGAERCVTESLALLLNRERTGQAGCGFVSLFQCARELAAPMIAGLTVAGGHLGGGSPFYGLYQTADGWIAIAALEPHFAQRVLAEFGLASPDRKQLDEIFRTRTATAWEQWAIERDLPIAAIKTI